LIDGLIFFVHPGLSLPGLSVDQLQSIFRGKVTNWKVLGGPDLEILPISLDLSATSSLKQLLGSNGDDIGKNVKIVRDYTTAIRQVAITPGAISYASSSVIVGQKTVRVLGLARADSNQYISGMKEESGEMNTAVLQDGTYPFTRRLFVIIRRDGTPGEQAGVAYANLLLSREAQSIIQKAGFVSLY
jgi:phosphate transport system substrate-binding protein